MAAGLFWILYQAVVALTLMGAGPFLLAARGRHYWTTLPGRLGFHSGPTVEGGLWIHAVSVGEVGVAATLVQSLSRELPLVVTTITPTGQERARAVLADRASVAYLPFELGWSIRRFFRRFQPRALVLVEGDLWPLLLHHARRRGLQVVAVNGRVSDGSFRRLRLAGPVAKLLFSPVDRFGVQTEEDREKLLRLGVPGEKVVVTGNLKYESPEPPENPELAAALQELAAGRPILVAGSTMAGEEEKVLLAFQEIGGGERALLILAPRHPERWDEVERLLQRRGIVAVRRSRVASLIPPGRPAVVLLDSLGELASLYRMAAAAFIGGTLVPTGGHNPLEAARYGVPVVAGPAMGNFRDMAEQFDRAEAWARVKNPQELARIWREWLENPDEARRVGARGGALIEANRGALGRTLGMLREVGVVGVVGVEGEEGGRDADGLQPSAFEA